MKATGIVRRVDDLGRIVIPKRNQKNPQDSGGRPLADNIDTNRQVLLGDTQVGTKNNSAVETLPRCYGDALHRIKTKKGTLFAHQQSRFWL